MDTSKVFSALIPACLLFLTSAQASQEKHPDTISPNVIYGDDNRIDYYQISDVFTRSAADATVALIRNSAIQVQGDLATIHTVSYGQAKTLCKSEPFYDQETAAICTGFLVNSDTIVTAGHCISSQTSCLNTKFVFDFKLNSPSETAVRTLPSDRVFGCKQLIYSQSKTDGADFAVVTLDRAVTHVQPLNLNLTGMIQVGDALTVLGFPSGLPLKVAAGASVRKVLPQYFQANLDTFGGNSGSPVVNTITGQIEGILVRGEQDFVMENGCHVSKRCADDACRGEDVTLLNQVAPYLSH
jgi:hypothetical protein